MTSYKKEKLNVIQANSLRELVDTVNGINASTPCKILKDDIVLLHKDAEEGTWFLLYYN